MDFDELSRLLHSEPAHTVIRTVWSLPAAARAQAAQGSGMRLTDFLSAPGSKAEQREQRYQHILGAPVRPAVLDAWIRNHPRQVLPADLRQLLVQVNGIHLWANADTGRSYVGLAPLEEWELARDRFHGVVADTALLDDRYLAVTYHQDQASCVVLDVDRGRYFLMDAAGPDTSTPIANDVGGLLDWLWRTRIAPKAS